MNYAATLILAEDVWDIDCPIGEYTSEQAAQQALNSAKARFAEHEGCACIRVAIGQQVLMVTDEQVTIRELNASAQARLGPPLDMRDPGNAEIAVAALHSQDPAYVVKDVDFVPSEKSLRDFLVLYGDGYKPAHIADRITPVAKPR